MKKTIIILALLIPALARGGGTGTATITRIIDGDTLEAICQGKKETIRLIGMDTPESKANRKAKRDAKRTGQKIETITARGRQALVFVRSLLKSGDTVTLTFDKRKRDRYSRLLAYVYLSPGRMLNEELIKAGHAQVMTIRPNIRHRERFKKLYQMTNSTEDKK